MSDVRFLSVVSFVEGLFSCTVKVYRLFQDASLSFSVASCTHTKQKTKTIAKTLCSLILYVAKNLRLKINKQLF